ncbi:MAG TPA: hypothetical protein VGM82_10145 [Gemmatimonadaceae bacterium]|jgi:hypothetical protein
MKKQAVSNRVCYTTMRRARTVTAVTLLAFASILTACSGSEPTGPNGEKLQKNPAGSYDISTVNDKALPVAIFSDTAYTFERTSGTIVLSSGGNYTAVMTSRQTIAGKVDTFVDSTGGTWALVADSVRFTDGADGTIDTAAWSNVGKLTFAEAEGKGTNTYLYVLKP